MRRESFIVLLLAFVTVLVYAQVADFDFTNLDDGPIIFQNPNVTGGLTFSGFLWALTTRYFDFWHPVTWWSHMLDCTLFGLDPGNHHLVNLAFHVANTLLLFAVLRRMTGAVWRSAAVAALFALHPTHVESVAWLAERKDVLSTFFGLLALLMYTRYAQDKISLNPLSRRSVTKADQPLAQRSRLNYSLALVFFALGLMSKPMLVTLPFVLLLLDFWPLQRISEFGVRSSELKNDPQLPGAAKRSEGDRSTPWHGEAQRRRLSQLRPSTLSSQLSTLLLEKLPFFVLSAVSCAITYLGMRAGQHLNSAEQTPWGLRLANVPVSYVRYLGKLIWPADLAALYPMPAHWGFWPVTGSIALLGLLTWFVLRRTRSAPWLFTGWFMFLGTLVPVIGFVPNGYQSIADRYLYIPSLGVFLAGVWTVAEVSKRWPFRNVLLPATATLALLACGTLTCLQAACWRNSLALWTHCVAVTRDNVMARVSLGNALQQAGRNPEAVEQYREVLRLDPDQPHANLDLGVALAMSGQLTEATNYIARAVRLQPDWGGAHLNLGQALFDLGDFSGALAHYQEAMRLDSNTVVSFASLAGQLSARGRHDEAIDYYLAAIRIQPADPGAHYRLGLEYLQRGRPDEAIAGFREAVRLEPDLTDAHFELAGALAGRGDFSEAITQYHEALRLDPDLLPALNNLAWLLATRPEARYRNGPEAVRLAEHACELTGYRQTVLVGTLAAAYAEAGRFDDAVTAAQQACALASGQNNPDLLRKNRELLARYQAHQPCREP